ncbi:hypothetical protein NKH18_15150 [Streptomyces sp. M10(2022)]
MFPGGAQRLVDSALHDLPGTVRTRVDVTDGRDAGFNVRSDNGDFRIFDTHGRLDFHAVAKQVPHADGQITVLDVRDGAGTHQFNVVALSDGQINDSAQARFLDTSADNPRVLDGNLNELPHIQAHAEPGGGYRVPGPWRASSAATTRAGVWSSSASTSSNATRWTPTDTSRSPTRPAVSPAGR